MGELVDLGVKVGIVEKSGSWFSCDSTRIGQGRENAKNFLRENPEMANMIERKIRQDAGLIADDVVVADTKNTSRLDDDEPEGAGTAAE